MSSEDIIGVPIADTPAKLGPLIADAMSDGDLPAALSYFETSVVVALLDRPVHDRAMVEQWLAAVVNALLAIDVQTSTVLVSGPIALIRAGWTAHRVGPDGEPVVRHGSLTVVARRSADGGWRVVLSDVLEQV